MHNHTQNTSSCSWHESHAGNGCCVTQPTTNRIGHQRKKQQSTPPGMVRPVTLRIFGSLELCLEHIAERRGVTVAGLSWCMSELGLVETKAGALTNLLPCFSERGGQSVWPRLIPPREREVSAHSPTCECVIVHTSHPLAPPPSQSHSDQTPRSKDEHIFSLGLFSTTPSTFEIVGATSTYTHLDPVLTTPSTLSAADAFTKSHLVTTPSKPTICHTTVWKPSTTVPCTTMRTRLGQGNTRRHHVKTSGVKRSIHSTPLLQ